MKPTTILTVKGSYNATTTNKFLLLSDIHLDSKYCEKNLLKRHLEQAKKDDAKIFVFGDLFDAMQGRNDRRSSKKEQTNLNLSNAYFNDIIDQNYKFLEPYKENLILLCYGNHETAMIKHNDIDLLQILCDKLGCEVGSYAGFVRFQFSHTGGGRVRTTTMYWHHGTGGDAPVTKGIMQHYRQSAFIDADIIVSGHNHWQFKYPQVRMFVNKGGQLEFKTQSHVKIGTYKNEVSADGYGFMIEGNNAPRPLGGWWLEFYMSGGELKYKITETES